MFKLPLRQDPATIASPQNTAYYVPGSVLRVAVDPKNPLAHGYGDQADIFFDNSPVFRITDLTTVVPIATFVLKLSSPEMLIVGVWGLTLIAALRGRHFARGLLAGVLGLLLGTIGNSARGDIRGTMGIEHLLDGIPQIPALMGLFCAAELFKLMRTDYIVEKAEARRVSMRRILAGARDTVRRRAHVPDGAFRGLT